VSNNNVNISINAKDNASISLRKIQNEIKNTGKTTNEFSKEINKLGDSWNVAKIGLTSFIGAMGAMAVVSKVISIIKDARKANQELMQANNQLTSSIGYASSALVKQQNALEAKLQIDDAVIANIQKQISFYTKNESQIMSLTEATLNMSAATGMDAVSASRLLGKAISGQTSVLKEHGITVEETNNKYDRTVAVIEAVNTKFKDQAAVAALSKDGWDRLGTAIGNVIQRLGQKLFNPWDAFAGETQAEKQKAYYDTILKYQEIYSKKLVDQAKLFVSNYVSEEDGKKRAVIVMQEQAAEEELALQEEKNKKSAELSEKATEQYDKEFEAYEKSKEGIASLDEKDLELKAQINDLLKELDDDYTENFIRNAEDRRDLSSRITLQQESNNETIIQGAESRIGEFRLAEANKTFGGMKDIVNQRADDEITLYTFMYEQKIISDEQFTELSVGIEQERQDKINEIKINAAQQWLGVASTVADSISQINSMVTQKQIEDLDADTAKKKENASATIKNRKVLEKEFEKIDKEAEKRRKEIAKREKQMSLISSVINTAQAVTGALTMMPPPVGIAMAIAVGILGAVQAGIIASQAFAKGGVVQPEVGKPSTGDNILARVNPGERILTKEQNNAYERFGGGISFGNTSVVITGNANEQDVLNALTKSREQQMVEMRSLMLEMRSSNMLPMAA
jgi:hypothetical protein